MLHIYTPGVQVHNAVHGKSALFALKVSTLGDGATILAASYLHVNHDGKHCLHPSVNLYGT